LTHCAMKRSTNGDNLDHCITQSYFAQLARAFSEFPVS
jgi:hypothetical protein